MRRAARSMADYAVAPTATPTLDKMLSVKASSQAIGEFLEWLTEQRIALAAFHHHDPEDEDDLPGAIEHEGQERGCYAAEWEERPAGRHRLHWRRRCGIATGRLLPIVRSTEQLLADYFEIDLAAAERERRAILDEIRRRNAEAP